MKEPNHRSQVLRSWEPAALVGPVSPDVAALTNHPIPIVISQVYGGGGNTGATLRNDFVELHNNSDKTINLSGWSVQYASSTGMSWQVASLSGSISPGHYYLLQLAAGVGGTTSLPTPDAAASIIMSATSGKVALVHSTAALNVSDPEGQPSVADFVGYGSANASETAPAPTPDNTTAIIRGDGGLTNTDDNSSDFTVGAPDPRNSSSTGTDTVHFVDPLSGEDWAATAGEDVFQIRAGVTDVSIFGLTDADQIQLIGVTLAPGQLFSLTSPDLGLRIDTDGDGFADTGITLAAPAENATLSVAVSGGDTIVTLQALAPSTAGTDRLSATNGMDYLGGGAGKDVLHGLGGDALDGGAANDKLSGGSGTDWLSGGSGNNRLTGGGGTDIFAFATADGAGRTAATDFTEIDLVVSDAKLADRDGDGVVHADNHDRFTFPSGRVATLTDAHALPVDALQYAGSYVDEATGEVRYVYTAPDATAGLAVLGEHLTTGAAAEAHADAHDPTSSAHAASTPGGDMVV